MKSRTKNLLEIHLAVLLFGLTGIFGKSVNLPARYITLGRVIFATLSMGIFFILKKKKIALEKKSDYAALAFLGVLLAIHWTTFYVSIQMSTVAIGLLAFSSYPIFVTFLEPLIFREKLKLRDVLYAFIMFAGVLIIVPEFNIANNTTLGLLWGIVCALSYAVLSMLNRKFVSNYDGQTIAFYEQGTAAILLMPMLLFYRPAVTAKDMGLLVLLGVVFTGVAHSLFISGMKEVRAQTAGIIASLETVYGIISAAILLGEIPPLREIVGGVVLLGTALCSTLNSSKENSAADN